MPSPSRGNNFMLFLMLFGTMASIAVGIGLGLAGAIFGWSIPLAAQNIVYHLSSIFLPCLLYFLAVRRPIGEILPFKRLSFINVTLIIFMTICIEPLAMLIGSITSLFTGSEVSAQILEMYDQPFILVVMAVCVSPAIFEEMAMRGIVLSNYSHTGVRKAAIINGLFFGILHLRLEQFFYAFLLGVVFVYFVYYTKSIWASVLAHFLFNLMQTATSYFSYQGAVAEGLTLQEMTMPVSLSDQISGIIWLTIISVMFTFVFCLLMYAFRQYNVRRNLEEDMEAQQEELYWLSDTGAEKTAPPAPDPAAPVLTWSFFALIIFYAAFIALNCFLSNIIISEPL